MAISIEQLRQQTAGTTGTLSLGRRISAFMNTDISFGGAGLSDTKKESFYAEMHLMFDAGIDLRSALDIYAAELKRKADRALFETLCNNIVKGMSLSEAMTHSGRFSEYEVFSVGIGEETGQLKVVLGQLADHYGNRIRQRRQIVSALSYPVLVFITSIGAVVFMLQVVVPMFQDVFTRFGSELPYLTLWVMSVSDMLSDNGMSIFIGIPLLFIMLRINRRKIWFRKLSSAVMLRLPYFGAIVRSAQLARFSSAMYLLISSRHPLVNAISLVRKMVDFYPIESSLREVEQELVRGNSLHTAMGRYPVYPGKMISMIKMAEEVNKLDVIFRKLADQYNADVDYRSSVLSSVLEPALIIFIGVMVAVILVAMYLPLFQMSTTLG